MNLSTETRARLFDLVIHAAWADQRICVEEVSAARAAARVLHPEGELGARGKLALGPEAPLALIARSLTFRESALGFAVVAWMALSDGVEHPRETALLDQWRFLTGVPRDMAAKIRAVVRRTRASRRASAEEELRTVLAGAEGVAAAS